MPGDGDSGAGVWGPPDVEPDGKVTDALVIHSRGRIVYISELSARWMGAKSPDEVIGRAVTDVVPPDQVYAMWEANKKLRSVGDCTDRIRSVIVRMDGSTSDCEVVVTRIEWKGLPAFQIELYDTAPQVAVEHSLEHQLALIAHASDALVSTTFHGFITSWNPAAEKMFDARADQAIGTHITKLADGQLHPASVVADGGVSHITIRRDGGSRAWIRVSASTMHNGYALVCVDHTALHRAEKRLQSILETLDGGLLVIGAGGTVENVNPAAVRLFGWNPLGQSWDDIVATTAPKVCDASGMPLRVDPAENTRRTGTPFGPLVFSYDRGAADRIWVSLHCSRLDPDDPSDSSVLLSYNDITEDHLARGRLAHAATHDDLTGLFNRAHVVGVVNDALRGNDVSLWAVLFIDLDNLKSINDSRGHSAGDHVLLTSAQRLLACARSEDVVARLGGDEFVCLIRTPPPEGVDGVCERIHAELLQPIEFDGYTLSTGASIGVRILADGDIDAAAVLAEADQAMYQAKSAGRGQTRLFTRR